MQKLLPVGKILAVPDTREKLVGPGVEPMISTSDEFARLLKSELARYGKIIKAASIKLEN